MEQRQKCLKISTPEQGLYDFSAAVKSFLAESGLRLGICHIFVQHTSASLLIQENADPSVQADLEAFFRRLVPEGAKYIHDSEGPDDMPAHIRSALTQSQLSIPFSEGRLLLGAWQGVYLWEHRRSPHQRSVILHLLGE